MTRRIRRRRGVQAATLLLVGAVGAAVLAGGLAGPDATVTIADPSPTSPSAGASGTPAGPTPGPPLHVVALGDSVPSGAMCDCRPFPVLYADGLADRTDRRVVELNLASGGSTTSDVVSQLADGGEAARPIAGADVVLVTVGANDLAPALDAWTAGGCDTACEQPLLAQLSAGMASVLAGIRRDLRGRPADVLVTTYWNVFVDGPVARYLLGPDYQTWSADLTRRANEAICRQAATAGATCVDLLTAFKGPDGTGDPGGLLAADGDHPNERGQAVIARALLAAGLPRSGAPPTRSPGG